MILRNLVFGALVTLMASGGASGAISLPDEVSPEFELVFADEFNGESLRDVWSTCYWWQVDGGCRIASNDEQQWYTEGGVSVGDGVLSLTATADPQRTTDGETLPYQSGMVSTGHVDNDVADPGFVFTYGYIEARVKLPAGEGTWPAVWLLSADRTSLPELDMIEWYGSDPTRVTGRVHNEVDGERASEGIEADYDDLSSGWHKIGTRWESDRVVFYFDGEEIGRVDDPDLVPQTRLYLILNLAMGGVAGDVDNNALPATFEIDYIRVWQRGGR